MDFMNSVKYMIKLSTVLMAVVLGVRVKIQYVPWFLRRDVLDELDTGG